MGKLLSFGQVIITHNYVFKTPTWPSDADLFVDSIFEIAKKMRLSSGTARKINTKTGYAVWSMLVTGEEWAVNKFIEEADRAQYYV